MDRRRTLRRCSTMERLANQFFYFIAEKSVGCMNTSSTWNAPFTFSIEAQPHFGKGEMPGRRAVHPSFFCIILAGMSDKVNKCVFPGGRVVGRHPIADGVEPVFCL